MNMKKVAVVTGAYRGIGKEITRNLAQNGFLVVANYNKSEKEMLELKTELQNKGLDIQIIKADVSKGNEVKKIIDYVISNFGKIDIVINNAGISSYSLISETTDQQWQEIINTNLYSAFAMCREVTPYMVKQKNGCIINISSIWGIVGSSLEVVYSISKAGINGLTKALAKELGPSNIRVNAIAPGIICTEMNDNLSEEELKQIKSEIPLEKIGTTKDIWKCVEWLLKDEYTTGQIISVNGGWVIT